MFQEQDVILRTEAGQQFAANHSEAGHLPRKLRTVLLAVDNETPMAMYRRYLRSFGDIDALFQCLYDEGLITVQSSRSAIPTAGETAPTPQTRSAAAAPAPAAPTPQKRSQGTQSEMSAHDFDHMMANITSAVEEKLGGDGLELLMALDALDSYSDLKAALPSLEKLSAKVASGSATYKTIRKLVEQAA